MDISKIFEPRPTLSEQEVKSGPCWFTWKGTVPLGFNSITTSAILVAFALALGANNFQIGILAAISFVMQIFQMPSIWLVEKLRHRKTMAVIYWLMTQLLRSFIIWPLILPPDRSAPSSWHISLPSQQRFPRGMIQCQSSPCFRPQ